MTDRMGGALLAGVGAALALGYLLFRADLERAAQTGPRWKRRLVGAGIIALTTLGIVSCNGPGPMVSGDAVSVLPAASSALEQNATWRELNEDWREAGEIAAGKRGAYPFTQSEKDRFVARLNDGNARLDELAAAGLLTAAEAGLLRRNVADRLDKINGFRPTEMQLATCYEPMMLDPRRESFERLGTRLTLLRELVAGGTVHHAAAAQIIPAIEQDLQFLATAEPPRWAHPAPEEEARREATRRDAGQALAELKKLLANPAPEP